MEYPEDSAPLPLPEGAVIIKCPNCDSDLLGDRRGGDWIEHHDDGSHTYHPPEGE